MRFSLSFRPVVLTGWGTLSAARNRIGLCGGTMCLSSAFGYGRQNSIRNPTAIYGYNIEVFKRGKHRKSKHYVIYRYTFPIEMFKMFNVKIEQGSRTFKIIPQK
jgi:hypothetical protein